MNFKVRANGYVFSINSEEETIVEDFVYTHNFQTTINKDDFKYMSFVIKA